ncbi:DNA-binding transcriptional regulator, XRE-family HTH domain [Natronincola peptidivorans]|uniref:DNA-binding transcriptional regulator, XRE-family HTH domain n=1 Tax=Natronincola peptidivorans TaxID=426128 RepID=A0A1I0C7F0_9FIRM|nr:helix-turn-helix transcriptional regulator [Natronincola peptidivorans]SET15274.1 DNA-binding transcriptional regulator, XRE-family HTH domain [Natronincola peptidivorans]
MLGERIKKLREEQGLSQLEMAKVLGVGNSTMSMYESNARKPDYETLKKIADYFNVTTDYLLGLTEIPMQEQHEEILADYPEIVSILRRNKKKLTESDKKRIARIIEASILDED